MANTLKDLTGQKFGLLTVIGRGEDYISPKGNRRPRWICQCECGGTALCQGGALTSGRARSCGCLAKESARQIGRSGLNRKIDITGERYGRLVAITPVRKKVGEGYIWLCKCDCGNEALVSTRSLRSGNTLSCGCLRDEKITEVNKKHGMSHKSRLYNVWVGMRQRCSDPNHTSYHNYGGRGIRVCDAWNDYVSFEEWSMKNGYDPSAPYGKCTLDRIDVNGNYEPSNCRWVDFKTQANNKR